MADVKSDVRLGALDDTLGYLLRRAQIAVFEDFGRRFEALGLTPAQYSTLVVIAETPGLRQADVAAALGVQPPNFVSLINDMERRGLVERLRSEEDRRAYELRLTGEGAALLERARAAQEGQEQAIRDAIGEPERRRLLETLRKLSRI